MRVALDTNVLASAIGTRGLCADVLRVVVLEHELILGEHMLAELRKNLAKTNAYNVMIVHDQNAQVVVFQNYLGIR